MNLVASAYSPNTYSYTSPQDEVGLIHRIINKDQRALELLYKKYSNTVFSLVLSIVQRREEAEDVLQELFMKIWEKAYTYNETKGSVYSWVVTMSRNKAIDRIRSSRYKASKLEDTNDEVLYGHIEGDTRNPLEETMMNEQMEQVRNALIRIPGKQREAVAIAYFQEMTHHEISEMLNVPLGTVKHRIREGKMKLKNILQSSIN